jgi:hypothetical protein
MRTMFAVPMCKRRKWLKQQQDARRVKEREVSVGHPSLREDARSRQVDALVED